MANNLNLGQLIGPSKPSITPTPLMPSVKPFAPVNNLNLGKLTGGPVQPNLSPVITPKLSQQQSLEINKPVAPTKSLYITKDKVKSILDGLQSNDQRAEALNTLSQKYILEGFNDTPGQGRKIIGNKITTDGGIKGQVAPSGISQFEPVAPSDPNRDPKTRLGAVLGADYSKSKQNLSPSAKNIGVNLLNMATSPFETTENLLKIPVGVGVNTAGTILEKALGEEKYKTRNEQMMNDQSIAGNIYRKMIGTTEGATALWNYVKGYNDPKELQRRLEEDPLGVFSDFAPVLGGTASTVSKVATANKFSRIANIANKVSTVATMADPYNMVTMGAGKIGGKILDTVLPPFLGKSNIRPVTPTIGGEFTIPAETIQPKVPSTKVGEVSFVDKAVGAYNGLDPETVRVMKDTPDIIKQLDEGIITKESIKNDLVGSVEQVKQQKKDVGGIYQSVYSDPTQWDTRDIIAKIENGLKEQGVKIKNNKITGFDTTKMTGLTDTSKSALKSKFEDVIGTLKDKDYINVEEYHNIRKDIYNTSYQEGFITKKAPGVNKLADIINEDLKKIPGFKEVDSGFKQASDLLEEIKSNVLDKQGDFKGTLKALLGERGQSRLAVLDKHFPGFKEKLKALAAYDDYLNTRTRKKVGLYEKAASAGPGVLAGFMTFGPIGAIIGGLASSVLKDFITDPKRFKDYIVSKAGKNLANKIELGTALDVVEQSQFKQIINDIQKQPDLVLPLKPGATVFPGSKGQLGNAEAPYKPNPSIRETGVIGQPYKKPVTPPKLPAIINKTKTDISNVLKTTPPPKLQAKPVTPTPDLPSTSTKNSFATFNSKYKNGDFGDLNPDIELYNYTKKYGFNAIDSTKRTEILRKGGYDKIEAQLRTEGDKLGKLPPAIVKQKVVIPKAPVKAKVKEVAKVGPISKANTPVAPKVNAPKPKLGKEIMEQDITQSDDLISEAKKYKSAEEFVKKQTKLYHGGAGIDELKKNFKIISPEEKLKYASSGGGNIGLSTTSNKEYAKQYSQNIGNRDDVLEVFINPKAKIYDLGDTHIDDLSQEKLIELSKKYDIIKSNQENEYRILTNNGIKTESQLRQIREQANKPTIPKAPIKK